MKKCFKCGEEKLLSEFYKHKQMKDGHLNKCKSCARADVNSNRHKRIGHYRTYDRARGNRQPAHYCQDWRRKYPSKVRAHNQVARAVKKKLLVPKACEVCGEKDVVAHHDDYAKPLDVRWLCQACHKQWHAKYGEGLNANTPLDWLKTRGNNNVSINP